LRPIQPWGLIAAAPQEETTMIPLIDMMMKAQGGQGIDTLARQFGLSQEQAMKAVEALMPAFSQGLKRNAADPMGLGALLQAFAGGAYKPFFDNAGAAFGPAGLSAGDELVGRLFGSGEVARAVAAHAARATGLAQETLREMMAPLALMTMGGLSKETTGEAAVPGGNVFADFLNQMMRQSGFDPTAGQAWMPDPTDNPFGRLVAQMWGAQAQQAAKPKAAAPGGNPFADMFEQMTKAGLAMMPGAQETPREPEPPTMPSGRPRNTYDDLFEQMFTTGRQVRDDYEKGIEAIFEQYGRAPSGRSLSDRKDAVPRQS
jgi:hypothetical protein